MKENRCVFLLTLPFSTMKTYDEERNRNFFGMINKIEKNSLAATIMLLFLFLPLFQSLTKAEGRGKSPWDVRVMTYNIRHGAGLDEKLDLARIAGVISHQKPDVVAIQELDSCAGRSQGRYELDDLARMTLMRPTYGPAIKFDGGKYGVGILSKEQPIAVKQIALPGKDEARTLLVVEFEKYVLACTHLSLDEQERMASLPLILEEARSFKKPFIMAGDWNDNPKSAFIKEVGKYFDFCSDTGVATFPADKPNECIDYIALYRGGKAVSYSNWVPEEKVASDHRPVVAELRLGIPARELMTTRPYLQDPQPTSMTVMFQTTSVCHCWVEYGTDSLHTQRARTLLDGQEVCYDIENKIVLNNLTPGGRYYYRVCAVDILSKKAYETHFGDTLRTRFFSFKTPAEVDKNFTTLIFNDLHESYDTYQYLLGLTKDVKPDLIIFNGDCVTEPESREHAIRMIHNYVDKIDAAEIPVIFIRGNHEIRNFYSAGMHSLIGYHNDKTYGSFDWGDTRYMVLDCGEDKPDSSPVYAGLNDFTKLRADELAYIKKELKSKEFRRAKRRILIGHVPIFGPTDAYHPCKDAWGPLLCKQPFDVAIFAHEHTYRYVAKGLDGAQYPVYIGGGPAQKEATVAILQKTGEKLHLKVLSQTPSCTLETDL